MKVVEFDEKVIEEVFINAEGNLLSESSVQWFKFDKNIKCLNLLEILDSVRNNAIVYCIWVRSLQGEVTPVYIGHSSSKLSRQRIKNHFIKKDPRTGSQLENVIERLKQGEHVGLSFLKIEPDYMRKPFEEWLISRNSEKLIWNKHGKINLKDPII